jgi:hypothetical protein
MNSRRFNPRWPHGEDVGESAPEYAAQIPMHSGPMAGFQSEHTLAAQFSRMLNEQDWLTHGQQVVVSAAAIDGGRPVESRQLLRARRRPPTTWTVQLIIDILSGEDPLEGASQNFVWTTYIGIGQAKAAIVRKFVVAPLMGGGFPQTVDQLVIPALEIECQVDWQPTVNQGVLKAQYSIFAAPRFA